jgi:hypothetical protein
MAGALAIGLIVHSARFVYDAFVFSTEWCVFLILLLALYNVVMLIISRARDAIVLWVVVFVAHICIRWGFIYNDNGTDTVHMIAHSARFIYDAFLFSIEWSIFLILILAIYSLVMLVLDHLKNALVIWVVIFCFHVLLRVSYSHSTDFFNDW